MTNLATYTRNQARVRKRHAEIIPEHIHTSIRQILALAFARPRPLQRHGRKLDFHERRPGWMPVPALDTPTLIPTAINQPEIIGQTRLSYQDGGAVEFREILAERRPQLREWTSISTCIATSVYIIDIPSICICGHRKQHSHILNGAQEVGKEGERKP